MTWIADIFLSAGAIGAGLYCLVLSRRLRRFTDLEKGVGGAVAVLSAQVDDLTQMLARAQATATTSVSTLASVSDRAEAAARRGPVRAGRAKRPAAARSAAPPVPVSVAPLRGPVFVRHPEMAGRRG
jgi:hypothetical protein